MPGRSVAAALRRRLFGIHPREVEFAHRGFATPSPDSVARLEEVGRRFVEGYHLALEAPDPASLALSLEGVGLEDRGFAYEGAGMALALLDLVVPLGGGRLGRFLAGPGDAHTYMVHIGAGWAWARLRLRDRRRRRQLDPVLGWLALDGYGFHEGYFSPARAVGRQEQPGRLGAAARRVFDSGLGRSLWFVSGGDPDGVADRIERFAPARHADLWAGAGLACCYAGGSGDGAAGRLIERAGGAQRGALAQGAAFAAKARARAGNPAEHTRRAVEHFCGVPVEVAAKVCDTVLAEVSAKTQDLPGRTDFERWRGGIRATFVRLLETEGECA